jgi:hypothetical protein
MTSMPGRKCLEKDELDVGICESSGVFVSRASTRRSSASLAEHALWPRLRAALEEAEREEEDREEEEGRGGGKRRREEEEGRGGGKRRREEEEGRGGDRGGGEGVDFGQLQKDCSRRRICSDKRLW